MEKFDTGFFENFGIIFAEYKIENNLIQTCTSQNIRNTILLFYTYTYYYAFLALKILKFQEKRAKIINISCKKKVVLRNIGNFEVLIY